MPRNKSEKRPFPHLPELVHRYYLEVAKWRPGAGDHASEDRTAMDSAYKAAIEKGHRRVFLAMTEDEKFELECFFAASLEGAS